MVDDFIGGLLVAVSRLLISQEQLVLVGIFVADGAFLTDGRVNADVMPLYSRNQCALVRDRPFFDVRFEEVSIGAQEVRGMFIAAGLDHLGGTDECSNVAGKGGRRIASGLFPTLLACGGTLANQVGAGANDGDVGIELAKGLRLPQAPGQDDWKGNFVELYTGPVRMAVDPEVLVEAAVLSLSDGEVNHGAQRSGGVAGGHERAGALHHVARPDQVVAAQLVVALVLTPGNAEAGDHRARIELVLVRQQEVDTAREEARGGLGDPARVHVDYCQTAARAVPLFDKALQVGFKGNAEGLKESSSGSMAAASKRQTKRELVAARQIDLSGQGNVAICRTVVLPIQLQVVRQVAPAVACAHVSNRELTEAHLRSQGHIDVVAISEQEATAFGFHHLGMVVPASNLQVGRADDV